MGRELEKKATVSVLGDRKIAINIPDGVKAGVLKVKSNISIGDLFKFLSDKDSKKPGRVVGIGEDDDTIVDK